MTESQKYRITEMVELVAKQAKIKMNDGPTELDDFAAACYDDNSITELVEAINRRAADRSDCEQWEITPTAWRESIADALNNKLWDILEEIQ